MSEFNPFSSEWCNQESIGNPGGIVPCYMRLVMKIIRMFSYLLLASIVAVEAVLTTSSSRHAIPKRDWFLKTSLSFSYRSGVTNHFSISKMNQTRVTEFLLLGFGNLHRFRIVVFILFLIIFLFTVMGNLLIILLVSTNVRLQSPMYYFLCHLSISDIVVSTNIVPNMLGAVLYGAKQISYVGCLTQLYFYGSTIDAECFLLSVMSYDRYLAICNPLRYSSIMDFKCQVFLSLWPWLTCFTLSLFAVIPMSDFYFCRDNIIDSFYCELLPVQQLSCSDTSFLDLEAVVLSVPIFIMPCGLITVTYVYIFRTIIRIPSTTGKQKTFSTCSSHLFVVMIFYGTLISKYMIPSKGASLLTNKIASLLHTVFTPLFNPIIYSLRNRDIKMALQKVFGIL
ncbi:olfactory receptor 8I2-like [Engystomops pustulosus]|uniref:olfactory receptor 8I2-like n=1 Tax=Engystomops pustulosus TaxID=76066 RepID=UPI003AFAEE5C